MHLGWWGPCFIYYLCFVVYVLLFVCQSTKNAASLPPPPPPKKKNPCCNTEAKKFWLFAKWLFKMGRHPPSYNKIHTKISCMCTCNFSEFKRIYIQTKTRVALDQKFKKNNHNNQECSYCISVHWRKQIAILPRRLYQKWWANKHKILSLLYNVH